MRLGLEAGKHTLDLAVELGIQGVPIGADALARDGVEATLAPLRERGLQVCQIGAFGYNPLSTDVERQAQQAALLERVIPLAPETGCPYVVINGGNYHPSGFAAGDARNFTDAALDEVAEALTPMLALADRYGARLSIEPINKSAIYSPDSFLKLHERVARAGGAANALRINVDPTSLYGYWDLWDSTETVRHFCTVLAGHYGLGHVKEVALGEGFHIHAGLAPLGEGNTDWSLLLGLIAPHLPEDSWVILEHVATPEEARNSLGILKDAAARAGVSLV
jgi:sugar phosphate isomerase/epimerase